jgi:PAS domain-containing protein
MIAGEVPGDFLRQHKIMFDNTWHLATLLAATLTVVSWYLGLAQLDVGPVIWTLAALGLLQYGLSVQSRDADGRAQVQRWAVVSQLTGTTLMAVSWHLFGGLKQPLFPLFVLLPLIPAALFLGFWQQQAMVVVLVATLFSGVILSPDTNSFVAQRYGLSIVSASALPEWLPKSKLAFADVTTSPAYDLLLTSMLALLVVAISSTARGLATANASATDRLRTLGSDVASLRELTKQLVTCAPISEVLVASQSGRIIHASRRFMTAFGAGQTSGGFLLDAIEFAYPTVIKQLMLSGGEEIQGAVLDGRHIVLRVRAETMGSGDQQVAAVNIERCDEICWRGEVDAIDQAVFAVNSYGEVAFLNRRARVVLGDEAEGSYAADLFQEAGTSWWNIAPLIVARRTVNRDGRRYIASIRRERIVESIGELSFIHLHEIEPVHAVAAS